MQAGGRSATGGPDVPAALPPWHANRPCRHAAAPARRAKMASRTRAAQKLLSAPVKRPSIWMTEVSQSHSCSGVCVCGWVWAGLRGVALRRRMCVRRVGTNCPVWGWASCYAPGCKPPCMQARAHTWWLKLQADWQHLWVQQAGRDSRSLIVCACASKRWPAQPSARAWAAAGQPLTH